VATEYKCRNEKTLNGHFQGATKQQEGREGRGSLRIEPCKQLQHIWINVKKVL